MFQFKLKHEELPKAGKVSFYLIIIFSLLIILIGVYAWLFIPAEQILSSSNTGGLDKEGLILLVVLSFLFAPVLLALLIKYRTEIFNRFPYLINLPAFFTYLPLLSEQKRTYYFNLYFEVISIYSAFLTAYLAGLEALIFFYPDAPVWLVLVISFVPIFISLAVFLAAIFKISSRMKKEINNQNEGS